MKSTSVQAASKKYAIPTKLFDDLQGTVSPPAGVDIDPSKIAGAIGHVYEAMACGRSISIDVYGTRVDNAYVQGRLTALSLSGPTTVHNVALVSGGDIKLGI